MRFSIILLFVAVLVFSGCKMPLSNLSPMETMKALNDAAKAKDTAKTKNLVSQATLDLLADSAKQQNKTVDELLQKDGGAPFQELPEMRNETITGDAATVEIKNTVTGEWQPIPFVKENGVWKVALDKVLADALEDARKAMEPPNENSNSTKKPVNNPADN